MSLKEKAIVLGQKYIWLEHQDIRQEEVVLLSDAEAEIKEIFEEIEKEFHFDPECDCGRCFAFNQLKNKYIGE